MSIRVAIIGVGNCANSFVQGLEFYRNAVGDGAREGLIHYDFGGYFVRDIEVVCAFDINVDKVGKDVGDAIFVYPNNAFCFSTVAPTEVFVEPGVAADGIAPHLADVFKVTESSSYLLHNFLSRCRAVVCICFLGV
jgi:myo-inositol-1-phosphate synthase